MNGVTRAVGDDEQAGDRIEDIPQRVGEARALAVRQVLLTEHHAARARIDRGANRTDQRPGALRAIRQHEQSRQDHSCGIPANCVDASACHRRGIRPARNANRPPSTACRIANAIRTVVRAAAAADGVAVDVDFVD